MINDITWLTITVLYTALLAISYAFYREHMNAFENLTLFAPLVSAFRIQGAVL